MEHGRALAGHPCERAGFHQLVAGGNLLWPSWAAMGITMASTNRCKTGNYMKFLDLLLRSIAEDRGNLFFFNDNFWLHMLVQRFWRRSKILCLNFKIIFQFAFFDRLRFRTCFADSRVVSGWQLQPGYWAFSWFYSGSVHFQFSLVKFEHFNHLATETQWPLSSSLPEKL